MANLYENNEGKQTHNEIGLLLVSVNATIEKQIEQIKQEVEKFTEFLAEMKDKSHTN
jgi:maleate cis-trans isomerase